MMDKAIKEKSDAYIVGKKIPNYKLAKNIFSEVTWGMEIMHGNQRFVQLKIPKQNVKRFQKYVEKMCQGIFMRKARFDYETIC